MKKIKIMKSVLGANDQVAGEFRKLLTSKGVLALNVMSSPGSGKTTLLRRTVKELKGKYKIGIIEGDIETSLDAEKFSDLDVPVVSINTGPFGGDCHLEAPWIQQSAENLDFENLDIIFIENIGNLVCPAEFDTGSHGNVTVLSMPEGEDKPLKYPLAFNVSKCILLNKVDLEEILEFDTERFKKNLKKVNPKAELLIISAKTGRGFEKWLKWVEEKIKEVKNG